MFFLIKYGVETSPLDINKYMVYCSSCESDQWADIMILSDYYYFFAVPIFQLLRRQMFVVKNVD